VTFVIWISSFDKANQTKPGGLG